MFSRTKISSSLVATAGLLAATAALAADQPAAPSAPEQQPGIAATKSNGPSLQLNGDSGSKIQITQAPGSAWQLSQQSGGIELQCAPEAKGFTQQPGTASATPPTAPATAPAPLAQEQYSIVPPSELQPAQPAQREKSKLKEQSAGEASANANTSSYDVSENDRHGGLRDEVIGLKPQIGAINFHEPSGATTSRGIAGIGLDINFSSGSPFFLGPSTGVLFSRVGSEGSTFFGGSNTTGGSNSNLLLVPADLKLAWNPGNFQIGVHGGGNAIYQSTANSVALGNSTGNGKSWNLLPNAGADLEIGFSQHAALLIRPDVTFGTNRLFTGTVGISVPIG